MTGCNGLWVGVLRMSCRMPAGWLSNFSLASYPADRQVTEDRSQDARRCAEF
jgi:hypothetical protein